MNRTRVIVQTMITLASASLGLVAALAWNEAIKALIKRMLGEDDSLAGLFIYRVAILTAMLAPNTAQGRSHVPQAQHTLTGDFRTHSKFHSKFLSADRDVLV